MIYHPNPQVDSVLVSLRNCQFLTEFLRLLGNINGEEDEETLWQIIAISSARMGQYKELKVATEYLSNMSERQNQIKEETIVEIKPEAWTRFLESPDGHKLIKRPINLRVGKPNSVPYRDLINLEWNVLSRQFKLEDLVVK
jgi:hypothetical protein